jgi:hypothetical protein
MNGLGGKVIFAHVVKYDHFRVVLTDDFAGGCRQTGMEMIFFGCAKDSSECLFK